MIFGGILGLVLLALWVWCVFDVIAAEESFVRNMPKVLWLLVVIVVPTVGAVAWLALGRPEGAGLRPGTSGSRGPRAYPAPGPRLPAPRGPEDSPAFMSELEQRADRLRRWEEEHRRREEDLRRREEGS